MDHVDRVAPVPQVRVLTVDGTGMTMISEPGVVTGFWLADSATVHMQWHNWGKSDQVRAGMEKALAEAVRRGATGWIADCSAASGALTQDDQEWIASNWVPRLAKTQVRGVATVLPASAIAKMSAKRWQTSTAGSLHLADVATLEDAVAWLRTLQPARV